MKITVTTIDSEYQCYFHQGRMQVIDLGDYPF
jgi:hypothetical protein